MTTIKKKKNKGKGLIGGDKVIQTEGDVLIQTRPPALMALKLVPPVSSEKRKTVSRTGGRVQNIGVVSE